MLTSAPTPPPSPTAPLIVWTLVAIRRERWKVLALHTNMMWSWSRHFPPPRCTLGTTPGLHRAWHTAAGTSLCFINEALPCDIHRGEARVSGAGGRLVACKRVPPTQARLAPGPSTRSCRPLTRAPQAPLADRSIVAGALHAFVVSFGRGRTGVESGRPQVSGHGRGGSGVLCPPGT